MTSSRLFRRLAFVGLLAATPLAAPAALAQDPAQPVVRTYVPANQLVAFTPDVPFDRFLATLEPIFLRVTGKRVVDPEGRDEAIGVPIQGMHFMDAFVYVLARKGLTYKENDRYFVVQSQEDLRPMAAAAVAAPLVVPPPSAPVSPVAPTAAEESRSEAGRATEAGNLYLERSLSTRGEVANTGTREIKISAIIFDLNVSKARELGINWRYLFGGAASSGSSSGSSSSSSSSTTTTSQPAIPPSFKDGGIDLQNIDFGRLSLPIRLSFAELGQMVGILENNGVGRTVASPTITVRSGREARIQVGDDIPVNTRDFQGNTQTQLIPTGTIARVIPTLVSAPLDSTDANSPRIDFVQIEALVERSAPTLFNGSVSISRNQTTTNVILLDGERTVIGGLYSNVRTRTRDGIPVLKDLPLLGNLFGRTSYLDSQREMIVILQAEVVRSVADRFRTPDGPHDLIEQQRDHLRQRLQGSSPSLSPSLPSVSGR